MPLLPSLRLFAPAGLALSLGLCATTFALDARADDAATAFVHAQHDQLRGLLRQPASPARDTQVGTALGQMVDYDAVARRAFGEPCPVEVPGCKDHWADLTDAQKSEVAGLLRRLVEKNYRKNLNKTLDFNVAYQGASPSGGDTAVHTEATSVSKPRDPAVLIDYVVHGAAGSYKVVDIVTEGASLTKSYYDQFHRMLTNPDQGYAYVVKKLSDKIAQPD
jgi:phospholipid transport system substrate-binding protein